MNTGSTGRWGWWIGLLVPLSCSKHAPESQPAPVTSEMKHEPKSAPPAPPPPPTSADPSFENSESMVKFPTSEVTVGSATSASGVPDADATIARNRWRFRACHANSMAADPSAEGDVKLAFELDGDGKVEKCTIASATGPSRLAKCASAAGSMMRFGKPIGTPSFTVVVRFKVKLP